MTTNNSPNSHLTSSSPILNDSVIQITIPVSSKLDKDNFLTWKSQIEPIINGFGLSHHIDDSSQPPTKTLVIGDVSQANPSFLSWHKQDQLLLKWLRSTISSPILSQYVGCKTTRHLWISLHRVYSAVSSARIMELQRSLQTKTRGDQACTEYFEQMLSLADQLSAAGAPIPDSDLVNYILNGLGSDYNSFVVAIRSDPVSLADLHGFLLSHEALLISQLQSHSNFSSDPVTLYTVQGNRGRGRGSGRGSGPPGRGSGQAEITTGGVNLLQMDKQNNNGSQGCSNSSHNIASQSQDKSLLEAEAQRCIDIRKKAEDKYIDMLLENALKDVSKLENQKRNI